MLNISVRSLQACKDSHVKVANFQMCIILSCARGNIDVFSPMMCLVGILYEVKRFICAQLVARPTQLFKCCHSFLFTNHCRLHKSKSSCQPHALLNMDRCIFCVAFSSVATTGMFLPAQSDKQFIIILLNINQYLENS